MGSAKNPVKKPRSKTGSNARQTEKSVGDALRRVYSEAAQEAIPDEMLDLLKKLN